MSFLLTYIDHPDKRKTISVLHGTPIQAQINTHDVHIITVYHPAVALYNTKSKEILFTDMQTVSEYASRPSLA